MIALVGKNLDGRLLDLFAPTVPFLRLLALLAFKTPPLDRLVFRLPVLPAVVTLRRDRLPPFFQIIVSTLRVYGNHEIRKSR
jgi:hypothetical protein